MIKEQTAQIVAAYLRKHSISAADIPNVINQVYQSLAGLGQERIAEVETPLKPAVSIKRSVGDDFVVCLNCGFRALMLRRHLTAAHSMTPQAYRDRWKLSSDHPLVARTYAARRSELAKANGLGSKRKTNTVRKRRTVAATAAD